MDAGAAAAAAIVYIARRRAKLVSHGTQYILLHIICIAAAASIAARH